MKKAMFVAVAAIAITAHGAINVTASRDYVDKKVYTLQTNLEERIENAQPGNYSVVSNKAMNAVQKTGGTITGGYLDVDNIEGGSGGSVKLTSEAGGPLIEMTRYDGAKWTLGYGWIMWPNGNLIGIPTPTSDVNFAFDTDVSNAINDLASVARSGSYSDLSDKPTKLSQFQNDSGFITASTAPVKTVNSKTGNVTLGATDVGAIPMSFGAAEMDPTSSYRYSTGDVMSISGKFYKAEYPFRPSTTPDPIGNEAVEELPDLKSFSEHVLRNSFLPLGYGGTNMPHYKKIDIGYESGDQRRAYLLLDTDGIEIQTRWNGEVFRIRNGKIMYTTTDWSSFYEIDVTKILTRNSVLPFRYNTEDYKDSPTSSYYVYQYLTNNYLTAFGTEEVYLKKSDASTTYLSKTDAASIYDTPDGVKSKISTALQNYRPEYTYREYGTYRTRQDGVMQRKILTSYWNVSFTNLNNGLTMKPVSGWPNKWTCDLGGTSVTVNRTNGVYTCEEYPIITATEDYDGDCVISFSSPLGVMVADSGTFDWEDYDRYVTDGEITNYYTRAETDAALDRKLDKSGGDMTGPLSVDTTQGVYRVQLGAPPDFVGGDGIWWTDEVGSSFSGGCGIYCVSLMGNLVIISEGNEIYLPDRPGTLALLSDVYTAIQQIAPDFTAKAYALNSLCTYDGVVYRCKDAYTATASSAKPNNDTTHWEAKKVSELFLPLTGGRMTGDIIFDGGRILTDPSGLRIFDSSDHYWAFYGDRENTVARLGDLSNYVAFVDAGAAIPSTGICLALSENYAYVTNSEEVVVGNATNIVTTVTTNSYPVIALYKDGTKIWTSDPADESNIGWLIGLILALVGGTGTVLWRYFGKSKYTLKIDPDTGSIYYETED